MFEGGVVGMECERNEGLEASGFVLQSAQLVGMVPPFFIIFDVAVEHGGIRLQADLMRQARGFEPLVSVDLVVADDVADAVGEDFGASSRKRIHPGML